MLKRLTVRNYVLIDSLETDFPEGLIIITGQTGAGKSILLGALSLLMGAKADSSVIGEASENCVVEGLFSVSSGDAELRRLIEEEDLEWDGGNLIIRRVVNPSGRSRAFLNDSPVSVQFLSSVSSHLIDIHSQHQTLLLSDKAFQMSLLDYFAGSKDLKEKYSAIFHNYNELKRRLSDLQKHLEKASSQAEYDRARLERLVSASLEPGELENLEQEQKILANAEEIKSGLCLAEESLSGTDDVPSVISSVKSAEKYLDRISHYMPECSAFVDRLASLRLELDDLAGEISSTNASMEVDAGRLAAVEERLSTLYGLMKSYGCSSVEDLIRTRDDLAASVSLLDDSDGKLDELKKSLLAEKAALSEAADALSSARHSVLAGFSSDITDRVRAMDMQEAVFRAVLSEGDFTSDGKDIVTFEFSSTGNSPVDLNKCASGGEMSRIMLALKSAMSEFVELPSMVFDEIDTGVSGSAADKMGSVICDMGRHMQVFAITHLPQVAAKGNVHYLVSKTRKDGRTVSEMERLSEEGRVLEIARMLSGSVLTEAAVENAKSLLSLR